MFRVGSPHPGTERTGALHGCRQQCLHGHNIHGETVPPYPRQPEAHANLDKFGQRRQLLARVSRGQNPGACSQAPSSQQVWVSTACRNMHMSHVNSEKAQMPAVCQFRSSCCNRQCCWARLLRLPCRHKPNFYMPTYIVAVRTAKYTTQLCLPLVQTTYIRNSLLPSYRRGPR